MPSELVEIRDYMTARELDVAAAVYIQGELDQRAADKEARFWRNMFGSDAVDSDDSEGPKITIKEATADNDADLLARSALGRGSASWATTQARAN